jgi:hypothetical protein
VIYEMLTGELPIGRFAPPSKRVCVDVRVDKVVLRSLEKQPELRYQSVSDVKTDMKSVGQQAADVWDARLAPQPVVEPSPVEKPPLPPRVPPKPVFPDDSRISEINSLLSGRFLGVIRDRQTYVNLGYLLLSLPLGIFYFVFLVTGFSVGIGLLILWIGLFVLLGTLVCARWFGALERQLASSLLKIEMSPRMQTASGRDVTSRKTALLRDSRTWTSVVYLLLKLPLGVVSYAIPVALFSTSLWMSSQIIVFNLSWTGLPIFGDWRLGSLIAAAAMSFVGLILLPVSLHIVNAMAWFSGRWARFFLARS